MMSEEEDKLMIDKYNELIPIKEEELEKKLIFLWRYFTELSPLCMSIWNLNLPQ